jgi:16S rRNA (cytosine1402-N4)-methyltransferase
MVAETVAALNIQPSGFYIDATLGRAGHAQIIVNHLNASGRLLVIDKDPEAILHAEQLFKNDQRVIIRQGGFSKITKFCEELDWINKVQGILLDLGVSSPQLDTAERGFSFQQAGLLDMRMDTTQGVSAKEWLADAEESEIDEVLKTYGEEKFHKRIARAIVEERSKNPITLTTELAEIIAKANPSWEIRKHPATRCFQAIRIFINDELSELSNCLVQSLPILAPGGRLVVLSFHSLEDRLVKQFIQQYVRENVPRQLISIIKKQRASNDELAENPRARSALLRVAEKMPLSGISPHDKSKAARRQRMKKQ